jgi:hypothetical protein
VTPIGGQLAGASMIGLGRSLATPYHKLGRMTAGITLCNRFG